MNIFDIMGPIMVGAVVLPRQGGTHQPHHRHLLGRPARGGGCSSTALCRHRQRARLSTAPWWPGSWACSPTIPASPRAFALAREAGMELRISTAVIRGAHLTPSSSGSGTGEGGHAGGQRLLPGWRPGTGQRHRRDGMHLHRGLPHPHHPQ